MKEGDKVSWIAIKMLVGDKAKFLGIVMGLTFAALLIAQQGSIFCGLMLRTCGQVTDITGVDLWVMDPAVRYIDDVKPMLESNLYRVRGVDGVRWAVPLYKGQARVKINPDVSRGNQATVIEQVILLGLDDATLVGAPAKAKIVAGSLRDLRLPDAIFVDNVRLEKLYPNERWDELPKLKNAFFQRFLHRQLEMNDHRAVIVGVCEATRTFQSNPVVYTTYTRAKNFAPQERKVLSYILAKTEPGLSSESVARRIASATGLGAKTSDEFSRMTIEYYLKYTGIPFNFGITALLGFLVGTAIAGQTFYNFTLENLKQFGALKAMGATNLRIVAMILLQATVVGLLGYGIGVGLAAWFGYAVQGTELAFYTWWPILPVTAGAIVLICVLSSLFSVQRVIRLEPAIVFR
jgi:putative ABC transport system permease protein